ncbi:MAG: hypothetical protein OEV08_02070, partial [Nitrospira sp.]|nr:hypothetical protein [Nitrospira sp.]
MTAKMDENSKRENRCGVMRVKGESDSGNQRFILSIHEGKIALDKPRAFTYHTRACAKGLISSAL